jgi:predicted glycoside hydrolase/deacetylase ChbG (UPF0249 family)
VSRLIVNADDFGLTAGVNRAIEELHRAGVLTSATLMAHAAATEGAIELACCTPTLSVGCHVVLVDGEPVLSPRNDIPHLADPIDGCFRSTLGSFLSWLYGFERGSFYSQKTCACEIEAETAVQIALLRSRGLRLTHIDTHKHVHMFPAVLRPVLRAAKAAGIRAVRNPFEPAWSLRATPKAPWIRRAEVRLLRMLEPSFRRIVAEEGFTTTDGAIGVLGSGTLDAAAVRSLLSALPEGPFELVTHPGYNDAGLALAHTRLLASRETERNALLSLQQFTAIELISFADLQQTHTPETVP